MISHVDDFGIRVAGPNDCGVIGRLLDAFNREFDDPTPGPAKLEARLRELIDGGDTDVVLGGDGPDGLAVLRFRVSIWSEGLECYLAELYVVPERRRRGLGRALMLAAMELARGRGADYMDLNTGEQDVAARALYESLGFSRTEGKANGPVNYYYERELR
jgi:ribosomal protein S18 acetylase RimI-like enzyme